MINICTVCGKEFEAQKSTKKYCCQECMNKARRIKYANTKQNTKVTKEFNTSERECLLCGDTFKPLTPAANLRQCCYTCIPDGIQLTRGLFLGKIKINLGGKCIKCGYDRCLKALEFHHLDPSKKDFTISNDHFKLKEAIEEVKKCVLLCSNCHKELHDEVWNIDELEEKEK